MQTNQSELQVIHSQCPECGESMAEASELYLMECDRCLSKRDE